LKNPNLVLKLDSKLYCVEDEEWSKARRLSLPFSLSIENVEISGSCKGIPNLHFGPKVLSRYLSLESLYWGFQITPSILGFQYRHS
jgi:hypothetical protein